MRTVQAVETLVHYIKLAFEKQGEPLSGDSLAELQEAVEAFRALESNGTSRARDAEV